MNMGEAVVWNTCEMCWCFCYRRSRFHDMSRGLKHFMWSEIEIAANLFWLAGAVVTTLVTHSFSVRPICSHWGDSLAKQASLLFPVHQVDGWRVAACLMTVWLPGEETRWRPQQLSEKVLNKKHSERLQQSAPGATLFPKNAAVCTLSLLGTT